jgi:hypothetical protein
LYEQRQLKEDFAMTWIPLGPILVAEPRVWNYSRLARANDRGYQCAVLGIAVHPNDEHNILVVLRRVGGSTAFRTLDDGRSWSAVADDLTRANPQLDLACAALHPSLPDVLYLGARAGQRVFVSADGGLTWPQQRDPGGKVNKLIVDRSSGPDWHTATLYAATDAGVSTSVDGGDTWTMSPLGEVISLAVYMPLAGPPKFYAGVYGRGLFYATAPGGPWQNLFGSAPGLPPVPAPGTNLAVYVDYTPRQPDRVYALVVSLYGDHYGPNNQRLYVSTGAAPAATWETRGPIGQPVVDYSLEGVDFLACPEPVGADTGDVLLCTGGVWLWRSVDGGRNWDGSDLTPGHYPDLNMLHHVDMRSFGQHPAKTAYYPDTLPLSASAPPARIYLGSDGGLAASRGYSDPSFSLDSPPGAAESFNAGASYDSTARFVESLNSGLGGIAAHQIAGNPDPLSGGPLSQMAYVTALDTGGARRIGSVAWEPTAGGDAGPIFIWQQPTGVRVWTNESVNILFPVWNLMTWLDQDPSAAGPAHVTTAGAPSCGATSNMVADGTGGFYAGLIARDQVTTLAASVTIAAGGAHDTDVYPAAMTPDLIVGARVGVGDGSESTYYPISAVASDHFTVMLFGPATHPVGTPVRVQSSYAARVSGTVATRISQVFVPQTRRFYRMARSGDTLLAASADQRLWTLSGASTATPASAWTELAGRPADFSASALDEPDDISAGQFVSGLELQRSVPLIACLTADAAGTFYVILATAVSATLGSETVSTVLFRAAGGAWVPERCTPPPAALIPVGVTLGRVARHPTQPGKLYVSRNARLFLIESGPSAWTWTDLTGNLPGQEIHDLWIGNVGAASAPPRFVLRALTPVRGVWELDLAMAQAPDALQPYFRDHAFDPGWIGPSVDGVASPLNPSHRFYHWQSADIKVDTPLRDSTGALYYQNDPEAPNPTPGDFAWIKDRSQSASAGTTARVWVRVNNRSTTPSPANLWVWALTCQYSGALPSLPMGFWSRFHADGTLDSSPPGGGWTSLGVQPVSGIHAESPGVAGFTMPTGAAGDHRCIVAFVHGPGAALDTTGLSLIVDEVVPACRQIAQRNVIVGPALPAGPGTPPPPSGNDWPGAIDALMDRHYIEFNNPGRERRPATVRFDLHDLPPALTLHLRFSPNVRPESVTGAKKRPALVSLLEWLLELLRAALTGRKRKSPRLPLDWRSYTTRGGREVVLKDLLLEAESKAAATLSLKFSGPLYPGYEYRLDILQYVKDRLAGGASLFIPVAGDPRPDGGVVDVDWERERKSAGKAESRRGG